MSHNCRSCIFMREETESWEMSGICWYECQKHPGYANLFSFPFQHTECSDFTAIKARQSILRRVELSNKEEEG